MTILRELAPQDQLLKPRDLEPIEYVPPQTWHCIHCDGIDAGEGVYTSVVWQGPGTDGPDGRCSECGQKYQLGTFNQASVYPALDEVK